VRILVWAILATVVAAFGCEGRTGAAGPDASNGQATDLKIGDAAPNFEGLVGTDGKRHDLAEYRNAKLVVLVFTCNHCPVARAYEDRLMAIESDYQPQGVQVVAVNVNNIPPDRLPQMKKRAQDRGFNFPYLYDRTQKIGHDYGADRTPQVFVLDKDRKVAYMGAIDDAQKVEKVTKHYLRDALDALLAGKTPPEQKTAQVGCGIKYEAAPEAGLGIGDAAPNFEGIIGVDDKRHDLAEYGGAKLVVLVFTCNHCPVAQAYEDRLMAIATDYQAQGVQVVAVNVNNIPPDRLDKMKSRAKDRGFNFPYLYDATQKIGHDYGAERTPQVFVLDKDRKVAYVGAIDDAQRVEKVTKHYLRDALDALLAGKTPPEERTAQVGCTIKYEE
jgi:peroxiredoxin